MKKKAEKTRRNLYLIGLSVVILCAIAYALPLLLALHIENAEQPSFAQQIQFPITVNPQTKTIAENAQVNALLDSPSSPLEAAAGNVGNILSALYEQVAVWIASIPWYQSIAAVDGRFVTITPGMRKEQAALVFADALGWDSAQEQEFLTPAASSTLPLPEGSFAPGTYFVAIGTAPLSAQALVNQQFTQTVLSHYGTTTAQIVPLNEALTVASLIQRESIGTQNMRIISGIIWNRLFANMDLQIDSTLQYAKANSEKSGSWWPPVLASYRSINSPYNTYEHAGLPPTPIANPSVAAVLAALNPVNTPCYFYFNDKSGVFHCSATYAEQAALVKKYGVE